METMIRSGTKCLAATALALVAAILALPANAQGWDALDAPAKLGQGQPYCMLWQGRTAPMINIAVLETQQHLAIKSPVFAPVANLAPGSLTFPSGDTANVASITKGGEDMVFFGLQRAGLDEMFERLSQDGQLTATTDGQTVSFSTAGIAPAIARMRTCLTHDLTIPPS